MNEPMNYPDALWRSFTGFTYKMSQASWNPENLQQSSVQILRDPGWLLKWVGCLIICLGIFSLFYLRPPRADLRPPEK
ncbi:MAG: cytochrome c biogenesis protein ResB [Blastochloris sp.]|nr:cytochrome c biogenesis protein ResB [Blastochloris sp.]